MSQLPVEQIVKVGIARIDSENPRSRNELEISDCVTRTYQDMHLFAKQINKTLLGITQSVNTEAFSVGVLSYTLYIITLVGTVVDNASIESQHRMSQLDPRNALRGR